SGKPISIQSREVVLAEPSAQRWQSKVKEIRDKDNDTNRINRPAVKHWPSLGLVVRIGHAKPSGDDIRGVAPEKSYASPCALLLLSGDSRCQPSFRAHLGSLHAVQSRDVAVMKANRLRATFPLSTPRLTHRSSRG